MPTLQELARAQTINANNPFVGPPPQNVADDSSTPIPPNYSTPADAPAPRLSPLANMGVDDSGQSTGNIPNPGSTTDLSVANSNVAAQVLPRKNDYQGPPIEGKGSEPKQSTGSGVAAPVKLTPEQKRLERQNKLFDAEGNLIDEQTESVKRQNAYQALANDTAQKQRDLLEVQKQAQESQDKLRLEHFGRESARKDAQLAQEAEELRNTKVDPQKWWKDRGTAGSILAAVSIGLGAFGAAMPHTGGKGANAALDIINRSIDNDIDAQKTDLETKWKSLNFKGSQNERDYVKGQWMMEQQRNLEYKSLDHAQNLIAQTMQKATDQAQVEQGNKLIQSIQKQKLDISAKRSDAMFAVDKDEEARARARAAASGSADTAANRAKAFKAYRKGLKQGETALSAEEWNERHYGNTHSGPVEPTKDSKKADDTAKANQGVLDAFDDAAGTGVGDLAVAAIPGSQYFSPKSNTAVSKSTNLLRKVVDARRATDKEPAEDIAKRYAYLMPNPWDGPEVIASKRRQLKQQLETSTTAAGGKGAAPSDDNDEEK